MNRSKFIKILLPLVGMALLNACGAISAALGTGTESSEAYLASAVGVVTQALQLKEGVSPFLAISRAKPLRPSSLACTSAAGGITKSSCATGGLQTVTFNDCLGSQTGTVYSGILALDFSNNTCDFSLTSGESVVVTSTSFESTASDTTKLAWDSSSVTNYAGTSYSGGYTLENDGGDLKLTIAGITRRNATSAGALIYEHTIHSSSALTVHPGFDGGTPDVTGSLTVDSNSKQFTASLQLVGVIWDTSTCCHPTAGTILATYGGTKSGSASFEFDGTCGNIKNSLTSETILLDTCY